MISLCLHGLLCPSLVAEVVVAEVKVSANTGEPLGIMLFDSLQTFRQTANTFVFKGQEEVTRGASLVTRNSVKAFRHSISKDCLIHFSFPRRWPFSCK